jgi:hypothetical protein
MMVQRHWNFYIKQKITMNFHEQGMQHNFGRFTCSGDFVDLGTGDISFSVMFLNNSVYFFYFYAFHRKMDNCKLMTIAVTNWTRGGKNYTNYNFNNPFLL